MIFPLEQLVKFTDNIYEITVAANRRAYQGTRSDVLAMGYDPCRICNP